MRRRLAIPTLLLALSASLTAFAGPHSSSTSAQQILSHVSTQQATIASMAPVETADTPTMATVGVAAKADASIEPEPKANHGRRNAFLALLLYRQQARIGR